MAQKHRSDAIGRSSRGRGGAEFECNAKSDPPILISVHYRYPLRAGGASAIAAARLPDAGHAEIPVPPAVVGAPRVPARDGQRGTPSRASLLPIRARVEDATAEA